LPVGPEPEDEHSESGLRDEYSAETTVLSPGEIHAVETDAVAPFPVIDFTCIG